MLYNDIKFINKGKATMKSLRFVIPVLVLALVFSFGCASRETATVGESVEETEVDEPEEEVAEEAAPAEEEKSSEESEKPEAVGMTEVEKIKGEIKTEVEGEIVKYQEESFYSEDDFSVILENEDEFKSQLIEKFEKEIFENINNEKMKGNESHQLILTS